MNLENILSEISQSQQDKHYGSMHTSYLEQTHWDRENGGSQGGGEERPGSY